MDWWFFQIVSCKCFYCLKILVYVSLFTHELPFFRDYYLGNNRYFCATF